MKITCVVALAVTGALLQTAAAQDAKAVIAAASKAMGVDGLNSIHYYGVAQNGNLGQNNNANQPWPMAGANDYVRAIDFTQPASRATWVNYAVPVTGGPAAQTPGQQNITPQNMAWAQQLEIWITPWGFLKGAAANNATLQAPAAGSTSRVVAFDSPVKSPGGKPYRVVGTINGQNLVTKVQTWLENPIFGDMLVETEYSYYRDGADGLKFPAQIVQKRGGFPTFTAYILGAHAHPANLQALLTPPAGAGRGGAGGAPPAAAAGPTSEKLADGVYRINGAYNALAIEFANYILLFEPGPQNEARAQAIIAETKKVIPGKPIRYGVISHHHFDHTSGIAATVAEGARIVSHESNVALFQRGLAAPRTLAPDAMSKSGKKPIFDPVVGDMRVFEDATRRVELHVMKGLPHADGMLMLYLPKEKIMAYADTYNAPPAGQVAPRIVAVDVMMANVRRVGMDFNRVVSVHAPNPDRPITKAEIEASLAATGTP